MAPKQLTVSKKSLLDMHRDEAFVTKFRKVNIELMQEKSSMEATSGYVNIRAFNQTSPILLILYFTYTSWLTHSHININAIKVTFWNHWNKQCICPKGANALYHNGFLTIVRIMSQCNRIFGDIIFTSCPIKLKFSSIISTF